jgi:hypothetical protein
MAIQPPPVATWLLRHFGCSPNNEAIIGDLDERYREGRSAAWYWRQAAASIVTSFFEEVSGHKLLTVWAMYIGWGIFSISRYGLILIRELLLRLAGWSRYWHFGVTITVTTAESVVAAVLAGWFVAQLCRRSRKAMVLAFAGSLECLPFVWSLQERFYGLPVYAVTLFTLTIVFTLNATGVLLSGGIFKDPKNSGTSGQHSAALT